MNGPFLYFAYGHNTNDEDFLRRCPTVKKMGKAVAPNFEMVMRNHADLVQKDGEKAYGVLWAIKSGDEKKLDYDEAFGKNYTHDIIEVMFHGRLYKSLTYVMIPNAQAAMPIDRKYLNVVHQGYKENNIPIEQLHRAVKSLVYKLKLDND